MPNQDIILNLPGMSLIDVSVFNPVTLHVNFNKSLEHRLYCNSKQLRFTDKRQRLIRNESIRLRKTYLKIVVPKYQCMNCQRYFFRQVPAVLP